MMLWASLWSPINETESEIICRSCRGNLGILFNHFDAPLQINGQQNNEGQLDSSKFTNSTAPANTRIIIVNILLQILQFST